MLNVRLDKDMEEQLNAMSREKSMSKSAIVKEALSAYLSKEQKNQSAYELGKDLFGVGEGGSINTSTKFKQKLKEKLHGKNLQ